MSGPDAANFQRSGLDCEQPMMWPNYWAQVASLAALPFNFYCIAPNSFPVGCLSGATGRRRCISLQARWP